MKKVDQIYPVHLMCVTIPCNVAKDETVTELVKFYVTVSKALYIHTSGEVTVLNHGVKHSSARLHAKFDGNL